MFVQDGFLYLIVTKHKLTVLIIIQAILVILFLLLIVILAILLVILYLLLVIILAILLVLLYLLLNWPSCWSLPPGLPAGHSVPSPKHLSDHPSGPSVPSSQLAILLVTSSWSSCWSFCTFS
jgi:hypothetical protein